MADDSLAPDVERLVGDPEFQKLSPQGQHSAFKRFVTERAPEFGKLSPGGQDRVASETLKAYTSARQPQGGGVGGILGSIATDLTDPSKGSMTRAIAKAVPVGADLAARAVAPHTVEQVTGEQDPTFATGAPGSAPPSMRPLTSVLARAAGGLVDLQVPGAGKALIESLSENRWGRIAAAAATDVAQNAAEWYLGGKALKALGLTKPLTGPLVKVLEGAPVVGSISDDAARLVARNARMTTLKTAAATGATVGTLNTVVEGLEKQEVPPLSRWIANPVAVAAFGLGIHGAQRFTERFALDPSVAARADALVKSDPALAEAVQGAQQFAKRFAKATGMSTTDAGELAFKAARGRLDGTDALAVKNALMKDPELLGTEFGEHVLRMQRSAFAPTLTETSGPLRVTLEDSARRTSEEVITNAAELRTLQARLRKGEATLIDARGGPNDINGLKEFAPEARTELEVADFEKLAPGVPPGIMGDEAAPGVPPPPAKTLADEVIEEAATTSVDPSLLSILRDADLEPPPTALLPGAAPTHIRTTHPGELLDELSTEGLKLEQAKRRLVPGAAVDTPDGPATVVRSDDPVGATIAKDDGTVTSAPQGPAGNVIGMDVGKVPPAVPGVTSEADNAAAQMLKDGKRAAVRDARGRFVRVTPDAASATAVVEDTTDGTVRRITFADALTLTLAGKGREVFSALGTDEQLFLMRKLVTGSRTKTLKPNEQKLWAERFDETWELFAERYGAKAGLDDEGLGVLEGIKKRLMSERGSAPVVGRPQERVGTDTIVGALAEASDARAFRVNDGSYKIHWNVGGKRMEIDYPNEEAAYAALRKGLSNNAETARLTRVMDNAVARDGIATPQRPLDPDDLMSPEQLFPSRAPPPLGTLRNVRRIPEIGTLDRYVGDGIGRKYEPSELMRAVTGALSRIGPAGRLMADRMIQKYKVYDRVFGEDMAVVEEVFDGLQRAAGERWDEIASVGFYNLVENGVSTGDEALDKVIRAAHQRLLTVFNGHYDALGSMGVEVADRLPNYLPHVFDISQLAYTEVTDKLVAAIIKSGRARTKDEALDLMERTGWGTSRDRWIRNFARKHGVSMEKATQVLDEFVRKNAERKTAHLEFDRLGVEGYVTDIRRAIPTAIGRNVRRLSEVHAYGRNDSEIDKLIGRITDEGGNPSRDFARRVFDIETGKDRVNLNQWQRWLYNFNTLKLSLSVIANTQQTANTLLLTDLRSTAKALGWTARDLFATGNKEGFRQARRIGAITQDIIGDQAFHQPHIEPSKLARAIGAKPLAERTSMGDFGAVELRGRGERALGWAEHATLTIFNAVENRNRIIASKAGEYYFDDLVTEATTKGLNPRLRAKFKELELDADRVVRAAATKGGDLREMRSIAALTIADASQFKSRLTTMPLWRESGMGRFAFQFKTFSHNQSRMVLSELGHLFKKDGDTKRGLRAFAVLATAYPAIGAAAGLSRAALIGDTVSTDQIKEAFNNPTGANLLGAYAAALAISGGVGIISDIAASAVLANRFALDNLFVPPMVSTAIDAAAIVGNMLRGTANADPEEFKRAARTASRAAGGIGVGISRQLLPTERELREDRSTRSPSGRPAGRVLPSR